MGRFGFFLKAWAIGMGMLGMIVGLVLLAQWLKPTVGPGAAVAILFAVGWALVTGVMALLVEEG